MTKPPYILSLEDIDVGYSAPEGKSPVVEDIQVRVKRGKLTALIAENGKGKSTLLKTCAGILLPLKGEVMIDGKSVHSTSPRSRARMLSTVFTDKVHVSNLTVYELIAFGRYPFINWLAKLKEEDHRQILYAAEQCGVGNLLERYFNELSDGEQQKVLLARTLAQNTPLIILDEPTIHLDLINRAEVLAILKKLVKETGKTVLFSSHQIDLVLQVADSIWIIHERELIEGSPSELIDQGLITEVFSGKGISFDAETRNFKLNL